MSASPSLMQGCAEPPFFSWLFSCSGIATSSWCTFTVSPLRCCKMPQKGSTLVKNGQKRQVSWFTWMKLHTCRFSSIILSRAWMKSSSSAHATCFRPPPLMVTSCMHTNNGFIEFCRHRWSCCSKRSQFKAPLGHCNRLPVILHCSPHPSHFLCWSRSDSRCFLPPLPLVPLPHFQMPPDGK